MKLVINCLNLRYFGQFLRSYFKSTRNRILLLYFISLLGVFTIAIPLFQVLFFSKVDRRVQENLSEELANFRIIYQQWESQNPETEEALVTFVNEFLATTLPEDDNFHLIILQNQLYHSKPTPLPSVIHSHPELLPKWITLNTSVAGTVSVDDPEVGSVVYKTHILEINNEPTGLFVAVHLTAGERAEAWAAVRIFIEVAFGVMLVAFLLAWVASHQLLKPVQQLAKTAQSINENNLNQRLAVEGRGELAELASTFNLMMDRVQDAFERQRNFINDVSHELRTPITIIQGHLDVMTADPQDQSETLAIVSDELERMKRFVNDMILLARAEQNYFLQPERIELQHFIQDVLSKAVVLADRNWQLAATAEGIFLGDRQRLTGALMNLVENAIQHTHLEDTIELGSAVSAQTLRLWVRDTGEGIAEADQQRIFNRFARATNRSRASEGAGLGLAIVAAMMKAHGGSVELSSELGVGATFTLIFPWKSNAEVA